jgi:hypothetical protein
VKRTLMSIGLALLMIAVAAPRTTMAQANVVPVSRQAGSLVPIKLQLVISRTMGEKKISSLPYTLWVTANEKQPTRLRMGVDVPVVQTVFSAPKEGGGATTPQSSYSYRPVGTNIDVTATTLPEGLFSVSITLQESGLQFDSKETPRPVGTMPGVPAFRNFTANFVILLKDGQTGQYTAATDPVTGEVLKVDATLNVLK